MSLHVEETGTKSASTIVFLHGMGTSGWMWTGQVRGLQDYHCLNIDLPGNGESNHQEWVSLEETADQVAEIIRSKATNGKAHIVSLSLGAYVALCMLDRSAELLESVILSGVTTKVLPNKQAMQIQMRIMDFFMRSPLFSPILFRMNVQMMHLPEEVIPVYKKSFKALSLLSFDRFCREVLEFARPQSLHSVSVRTLAVAGDLEVAPIKDAVRDIAHTMPHSAGFFVPKAHHGWPGEAPELCTDMVRAWITETTLPIGLIPCG